ncbi:MAG: UvrD-helicase domain-containing protein [Pirellulales bacterium]|nr:UvrD-helicase domain-containing protein [Pirellulales bacterium]
MSLNPAQRAAVQTLTGPLLVLAGAGTGKTRVVTYRIAELIRHGTRPERILAVTFTNKAADEMRLRSLALLGNGKPPQKKKTMIPEISTFHSLCVRILRRHAEKIGYPKQFSIGDRSDQESIARNVLREVRAPSNLLRPDDLLFHISHWKSRSIQPVQAAAIAQTDREHLAAVAYRRYQQALKACGTVDFDDLLLLVEGLFRKQVPVRRMEARRFDHILIDEYQDTNSSQYQIVRYLAAGHRNLCVVGDDDQSIYGWRGAEVEHILRFATDWPDAKIIRLEKNYRSTAAILDFANAMIQFNRSRHDKILCPARHGGPRPRILQFPDENKEAQQIVRDIAALLLANKVGPRDIAILCRTNEQPRPFETALRQANIPYILIGSMSFFDRREVRDLLAYLKILVDPNDEPSLLRILNTPPRGIGRQVQQHLVAAAIERGVSVWRLITSPSLDSIAGPRSATALKQFRAMVQTLRSSSKTKKPSDVIRQVLDLTGYAEDLPRLYPDPIECESRSAALEDIIRTARAIETGSSGSSLCAFLSDLALNQRDDDTKEDQLRRNAVVLMTLHSAKGLEFPHVYLVGMEEGILPHKKSIEAAGQAIDEERRLCYVGITRAMERLTLSFSLSRRKWGKARETVPSRFLFEMTGQAEKWVKLQKHPKDSKHRRKKDAS